MKKIWQKILLENPHLEKWDKWMRVFTFPGLDGVPVYTVLSFFISEIRKNSLAVRAKSIAYSFFFIVVSCIAVHLHINSVYVDSVEYAEH
jgi:hypothetical protein